MECLFSLLLILVPAPFLNCVLCGFSLATEVFAVVVAVFLSFSFFLFTFRLCVATDFISFFHHFFLIGSALVLGFISVVDRG